VLAAVDGEDALRLCEKETPAIAILDIIMPKLGGPSTAAKLLERFENLPLVYTSGYSPQCDNAALAASNAYYLQKPYSPSALSRLVHEILDQAKVSEAHY
jgi:two-component system cell cycle sensor histidine kinase/response regulator CckA